MTTTQIILASAAAVGATAVIIIGLLVYLDYRNFDRTSGGYSPPYTDWTGTPIDWSTADRTSDGFRQNGRVIDSYLDCTTGMLTFGTLGVRIDFREVSPRAIAVHQPREACIEAGFEPEF